MKTITITISDDVLQRLEEVSDDFATKVQANLQRRAEAYLMAAMTGSAPRADALGIPYEEIAHDDMPTTGWGTALNELFAMFESDDD